MTASTDDIIVFYSRSPIVDRNRLRPSGLGRARKGACRLGEAAEDTGKSLAGMGDEGEWLVRDITRASSRFLRSAF